MSRDDATPPTNRPRTGRHRRLAVPAAVAVAALAGQMAGGTYTVQKGDTLWSLSQRYGTTVDAFAAGNDLADPDLILIGQELEIPGRGGNRPAPAPTTTQPAPAPAADRPAPERTPKPKPKPAPVQAQTDAPSDPPADAPAPAAAAGSGPAAAAGGNHEVAAGDTLWSIAQANGTTVAVLRAVNDLDDNGVVIGQVIDLPSNGPAPASENGPAASPAPASAPAATSVSVVSIYRVQPGDTATSIAALFGVPVESLLNANQLSSEGGIEVGTYVRIPAA